MKKLIILILLTIIKIEVNAQYKTEGKYAFVSYAYYLGDPAFFKSDSQVTEGVSLITMDGQFFAYKVIKCFTEFDENHYVFEYAIKDGQLFKWVCKTGGSYGLNSVEYNLNALSKCVNFKNTF